MNTGIIHNIDFTALSITIGVILGIGFLASFWFGRGTIFQGIKGTCKWMKDNLFTWNGFFWFVNIVCMAYSAQNAGYIFGLYESTGLIVGGAIDLLIIVFTQSMLTAKARGETDRALKILTFIIACCLLSTIGNLAHNLHTNIDQQTTNVWFAMIIPYVVSVMPLFLIGLAYVADLKVNPIGSMSLEDYKALEEKRLNFVDAQLNSRDREERQRNRLIVIEQLRKRNKQLRKDKLVKNTADITQVIHGVAEMIKTYYDGEIKKLEQSFQQVILQERTQLTSDIHKAVAAIRDEILQQNEEYRVNLSLQYDQDITLVNQQLQQRIQNTFSSLEYQLSQRPYQPTNSTVNSEVIREPKEAKSSTPAPANNEDTIVIDDSVKEVINNYPIVEAWLSTGVRSLTIEQVIQGTGHSAQLVRRREKDHVFKGTKRAGYYRISSIIDWLKMERLPKAKETAKTVLPQPIMEQNTDEMEMVSVTHNGNGNGHHHENENVFAMPELSVD